MVVCACVGGIGNDITWRSEKAGNIKFFYCFVGGEEIWQR